MAEQTGEQQIDRSGIPGTSAVKEVTAPDGSKFQMMRGLPLEAARLRGEAFAEIRRIVQEREPGLLRYLKGGASFEYKTSSAVSHSTNPEVKADLVRVLVNEDLQEGNRLDAVSMLEYAYAAKLDLPQYNSEFILRLYEEAFGEGNFKDAQAIASEMLDKGGRIVEIPDSEKVKEREDWDKKELDAFKERANSVLAKEIDPTDEEGARELNAVYWQFRSARRDHFTTNTAQEVAKKIVKFFTEQAEGQKTDRGKCDLLMKAASYAEGAGLLEETRTLLKRAKEVNPDWVTRFTSKLKGLAGARGK